MSTNNPKLAKALTETYASFAVLSSELLNNAAKIQELLASAGVTTDAFKDPMFFPRIIGETRSELVGRFIVASLKLSQITAQNPDINLLTPSQKRELAKQFQAIADELKSISQSIG